MSSSENNPTRLRVFVSHIIEALSLAVTPVVLVICAISNANQTAALSFLVVLASLGIFFAGYEASRPRLRDVMPTVVLAALAAAGRILFAPIPDFKPVSAIAIIAGIVFGRKSGFMVGALAALASNFFFGQGAWTPWQMYAWGLVGYGAGLLGQICVRDKTPSANVACSNEAAATDKLANSSESTSGMVPQESEVLAEGQAHSNDVAPSSNVVQIPDATLDASCAPASRAKVQLVARHPLVVFVYGFIACLGYGFILNAWSILSFFHAQASGLLGILAVYATALPFDIIHGVATVIFLLALYAPWRKKLARIRTKFGLS